MPKKRPSKIANVGAMIRESAESGNYLVSAHAAARASEDDRNVLRYEVEHVLKNGRREPAKDQYNESEKQWRYSVRGKTLESRELRVVVAFDGDMIIVTVIELRN